MSILDEARNLTGRIRFRDGQVLTSEDLNDAVLYQAAMQRLHNYCLHRDWGFVGGLLAEQIDSTSVEIAAGIAILPNGRFFLLPDRVVIRVPKSPGRRRWVLAIDRVAGDRVGPADGSCHCGRSRVAPQFSWLTLEDFDESVDLGVCTVEVDADRIRGSVDLDVRKRMRPASSSLLRQGRTGEAGETWRSWLSGQFVGAEIVADISRHGFVQAPSCFADIEIGSSTLSVEETALLTATGHIAEAASDSFIYRVIDVNELRGHHHSLAGRLNAEDATLWYWLAEDLGSYAYLPPDLLALFQNYIPPDTGAPR